MKTQFAFCLMAATLVTGCASGPKYAPPVHPTLKSLGNPALPRDLSISKLHVEFHESETLGKLIRTSLEQRGQPLAEGVKDAAYRVTFAGIFRSDGAIKVAPIHLGPIFEDAAQLNSSQGLATLTPGQATGQIASQVLASSIMNAGYANFFGGNIVEALSKATGVTGFVNKKLFGHEKGICFNRCDLWTYSRQIAFVEVKIKQDEKVVTNFGRMAFAYQEEPVAQELIMMALESSIDGLLGKPVPAEPSTGTSYPVSIPTPEMPSVSK